MKTRLVNAIKIELMIKVRLQENPDLTDFLGLYFPFIVSSRQKIEQKLATVHLLEKMGAGTRNCGNALP